VACEISWISSFSDEKARILSKLYAVCHVYGCNVSYYECYVDEVTFAKEISGREIFSGSSLLVGPWDGMNLDTVDVWSVEAASMGGSGEPGLF
jgi:hypothetical protein